MATEGRDRGSPSAMGQGDQSAKKQRVELLHNGSVLKQEVVVHDAARGAVVPAEDGSRVEVTLKMDVSVLHCPLCFRALKPPVFKCKGGLHLACAGCVAELPGGQCQRCEGGSVFDPEPTMDAVVLAARVQCQYDGCGRSVSYYEIADHKSACPHTPCSCTEPGCGFAATPAALVGHLFATHSMPVHRIPYGKPHRIQVPVPGRARRLLVGAGDDGGVFMLTVRPLGVTTVVSAVCVRGDACVSPRYTIKLWANGPQTASCRTDTVLADVEATSSATPGAVALEELTSFLTVPPRYLVGDSASKELSLHVRLEKNTS